MNKKQILKQLKIANAILEDIKKSYASKSLKYGKFALDIQKKEIERLNYLMKFQQKT